jgi:AbrB family looped-hinge helix DNA binding protein
MAKVTSKLQVTIPKRLAEECGIKPGDEVAVSPAGDAIRIAPLEQHNRLTVEERLKMFDASVERQKKRQRGKGKQPQVRDRGWKREDLYDRGRTR